MASSLSLRSFARAGAASSVLSFVVIGSGLSCRNFARVGSSLSIAGPKIGAATRGHRHAFGSASIADY